MRYSSVVSFCGRYMGLTRLLTALPKKPSLLVLNYHRVGNPDLTPYDPGVFSASAEQLDAQVGFLKRRFHIAALDEALEIIEGGSLRRATVLLTFDDGYRDNYETAFPILAAHNVQGVFFLPTSFIGTDRIAFWDTVAYIVKRSRKRRFRLPKAPLREFDIASRGAVCVVEEVLEFCKGAGQGDPESLIVMLEEACDAPRPAGADRLFMNWSEAAAMLAGGMAIESHTHTHPALAGLGKVELMRELMLSRRTIEERLRAPVHCLAYPYGLPKTLSSDVSEAVGRARYRAAFSFYGGINTPGAISRFDVRREAVSAAESPNFQLRTTLAALTARPAA